MMTFFTAHDISNWRWKSGKGEVAMHATNFKNYMDENGTKYEKFTQNKELITSF